MSLKFKPADRSVGQILAAFWQRKILIGACAFVLALGAWAFARTLTPTYVAEGALVLETQQLTVPNVETFSPLFGATPGDAASVVRTQMLVLRSRTLTEQIARELELERLPEFNPVLRPPGLLARLRARLPEGVVALLESVGLRLPNVSRPVSPEEGREAALNTFQRNLDVSTDGRSFILTVSFASQDPELAAEAVNRLMNAYLAAQIAAKTQQTSEANALLNRRLEVARREVEEADLRVQEHRRRYGFFDSRMGTVAAQSVAELNTALSAAQADLALAEARYGQARRATQDGSGAGLAEVLALSSMPLLRQRESELGTRDAELAARLGPNHPTRIQAYQALQRIRQEIQAEVNRGLQALSAQVLAARTRVGQLQQQVRQREQVATQNAEAESQLQVLQRDAEAKRTIYNTLQQSANQTAQGARTNQADARIVTAAVAPVFTASPRTPLIVGIAGFVGLLVGCAIAMVLAELDRGFERSDEIESASGLTPLGVIPVVRWPRGIANLSEYVVRNPSSAVAETLRGMREALRSAESGAPKVLLVTSSLAGEGKTSLATSIARLHARDGERVLLIEADFRRPTVGAALGHQVGEEEAAFSDALEGEATWREALRTDALSGLRFLVTAEPTNSPQPLLSSAAWSEMLEQARGEFDLIVIDSPPVMSVTDTLVLTRHADAIVLVVAWRSTQRRTLEATLKRLRRTGKPVGGFVLSKMQGYIEPEQYYAGYYTAEDGQKRRKRRRKAAAETEAGPTDAPAEAGQPAAAADADRVVPLPPRQQTG